MTDEITEVTSLSVLITGGMTALGRELTRRLTAAGHQVVAAANGYEDAPLVRADGGVPAYPNVKRSGELLSLMHSFKTDVVINAAPQAANHLPQQPAEWDAELMDEGVAALLEAAEAAAVKFVVHTSYAFADEHVDELGDFLHAVRAGEQKVLNSTVPGCVLRLGFLYGAESPALHATFKTLMRGGSVDSGPADSALAWVSAVDAASAVIAAVNARPVGELFTIVDDRPASPAAFMAAFAHSLGLSAPGRAPRFALWALPNKAQYALMSLHMHPSNADAKEKLGWSPRFADIEQGLDDIMLSWRAVEAQTDA